MTKQRKHISEIVRLINIIITIMLLCMCLLSCSSNSIYTAELFETAANGNKLAKVELITNEEASEPVIITVVPTDSFQTITGFGGSFTQASAHLLNQMSKSQRQKILEAYFGDSGARYSLTRTHINSCDFSTHQYAFTNITGDTTLSDFSLDANKNDLIPLIKDAMQISRNGFKIVASPWTAPPWMKDNNDWRGGKLLPQHRNTWAKYFSKYLEACKKEGISIWGVTVENEPLGNDGNWESMHFTAEEMTEFVNNYLGPQLQQDGWGDVKILGYDQNRGEELKHWVDVMYDRSISKNYFNGTAVHWYASTIDVFADNLQYAYRAAPDRHLIQTEACIDADTPRWQQDEWYWSAEATDWGFDWAQEKDKPLHPKYVPVFRYANDIIGCLNNWVDGWIDWNMVLNKQGGPNWFKNWCVAPIIADSATNEIYITPLYYTLSHFSRYILPGAVRVGWQCNNDAVKTTAVKNPDGSVVVIIFNPENEKRTIEVNLAEESFAFNISPKAIQTLVITNKK